MPPRTRGGSRARQTELDEAADPIDIDEEPPARPARSRGPAASAHRPASGGARGASVGPRGASRGPADRATSRSRAPPEKASSRGREDRGKSRPGRPARRDLSDEEEPMPEDEYLEPPEDDFEDEPVQPRGKALKDKGGRGERSGGGKKNQPDPKDPKDQGLRKIHVQDHEANAAYKYDGNTVRTTKYTLITFLPRGLLEQFRRAANVYFLMICIISFTPVSPVSPIVNLFPLIIVIGISMIKEAVEDRKRFVKDREMNNTEVGVLREGKFVMTPWKDVKVGEIVRVEANHAFPCDLIMLSSGNDDGICYIETMNLDGETNLKIRKALPETWKFADARSLAGVRGTIDCEKPNNSLYTFTGNMSLGGKVLSVGPNQVLLRGCTLRNTPYIHGIAIFTGHETKVMKNSTGARSKRSTLELRLDLFVIFMFITMSVLCIIDGGLADRWVTKHGYAHWYLELGDKDEPKNTRQLFDPAHGTYVGFLMYWTLITLYSNLIPISLYVSIEMVKYIQSNFIINKDIAMYHEESDTPALARTSNLNEELGMIEYVFSDKTGTLTQNLMEFFKCSIAGTAYGQGLTEVQKAQMTRQGLDVEALIAEQEAARRYRGPEIKGFNFDDDRLMGGNWRNEATPEDVEEWMRALAVCHAVIPEKQKGGELKYQAASPDDVALVIAAREFGFYFYKRTTSSIHVKVEHLGQEDVYEILALNDFNSTRKRMSIIVREPDTGKIKMYMKGADNVILERLGRDEVCQRYRAATEEHLEEFAKDGLRTLCIAYKELTEEEWSAWSREYESARTALKDREDKMDRAAENIERDFILLGCTAIEDKLQEGVPAAIEQLAKADIKLWMLTGDKVETAINIGFACSLLTDAQKLHVVNSDTKAIRDAERRMNPQEAKRVFDDEIVRQLVNIRDSMGIKKETKKEPNPYLNKALKPFGLDRTVYDDIVAIKSPKPHALVIDGKGLATALKPEVQHLFLEIGLRCQGVICCRVSPLQKALVTGLVKNRANKRTLAIGDGANDVSMIQAAHIGVGISGQEGMQAVMASDFAIAQFRFLVNLTLVHGAQCYHRISRMVGYFFYKNTMYTFSLFWFSLFSAASGQKIFDDWYTSIYNLIFTSLPCLVAGVLDQEIKPEKLMEYPALYSFSQQNKNFDSLALVSWVGTSFLQSVIIYFFPHGIMAMVQTSGNGWTSDMWMLGTTVYTILVFVANARLAMACTHQTVFHLVAIWGSVLLWFIFVWAYNGVDPGVAGHFNEQDNVYWIIFRCMQDAPWWLAVLLVVMGCLAVEFAVQQVIRRVAPFDYMILQENEVSKQFLQQGLVLDVEAAKSKGKGGKKKVQSAYAPNMLQAEFAKAKAEVKKEGPIAQPKAAKTKTKSKPAPPPVYDDEEDFNYNPPKARGGATSKARGAGRSKARRQDDEDDLDF